MTYFGIRFDFRNPSFANTSTTERYRAALDMVEWADQHGFAVILLSEHHGSDDGYLPSPLAMAAAMAARTEKIRIQIAALIAPFYDPIRLAEEVAVVDNLSGGRLDVVIGYGYVAGEFDMFGKQLSDRVRDTTEAIKTLRAAWSSPSFEYRGHSVSVTPAPAQPNGPAILLAASTEPAARRAAHLGDGFVPSSPALWEPYRDEMLKLGRPDPGSHGGGDSSFFHLAEDPVAAWDDIGPYALHEVNSYGGWLATAGIGETGGYQPITSVRALEETGQYRVFTPHEYLGRLRAAGNAGFSVFHPMMGGIPPALGWQSLRLFETAVFPRLDDERTRK
jgi:alkanesulfonate monooxygenase SsuD/methylene tetrahydromethanopterin reductase-like flavin-dependent oxidoreductase (luciferase family)